MRTQGEIVTAGPGPGHGAVFLKRLLPSNLAANWFLRVLARLEYGRLTVVLPDGERHSFRGRHRADGTEAVISIRRTRALARLLIGGDVGFAEAFFDGDWESPDLAALFRLGNRNRRVFGGEIHGSEISNAVRRLRKLARANTPRGSRRNIASHYDLGNDFYRLWLDSTMTYSSAVFERDDQSLPDAQMSKYRRIAEMLDLTSDHHVLEIGCGWGGLAVFLAREIGCRVTAITLSRAQFDYARRRVSELGLSDRVEIRFQDYRMVEGTFDRIASIEMIEAVGERNWPVYFQTLRERLQPGGIAALQAITIDERRFDHYRRRPDFIQEFIFPGGMLPSPAALSRQIERQGLRLTKTARFGTSYARTLAIWAENFERAWPEIQPLGFDGRFKRMWDYYLAYCEAGFRFGATDVMHLRIERD